MVDCVGGEDALSGGERIVLVGLWPERIMHSSHLSTTQICLAAVSVHFFKIISLHGQYTQSYRGNQTHLTLDFLSLR